MTATGLNCDLIVAANHDTRCDLKMATELATDVRAGWRNGQVVDVATALLEHPELRQFKSIVLDLACDEYRIRCQRGEPLSAEEFANNFPSLQRSLCTYIAMQDLLADDLDLQMLRSTLSWPEPGTAFLQFELIAEIGRGSFGRVFLAAEPALGNRRVALKVAPDGGEEAVILGRLQHANIVPIYSVQEDPKTGLTAFCMPYLGSATLGNVLDHAFAQGAIPKSASIILEAVGAVNRNTELLNVPPPDRVLRTGSYVDGVIHLAAQLADALAHSQKCGISHRDLKPSNVLLAPNGRPLLLDFNLSVDNRFTAAKVGGTLPYMAPEVVALFALKGGVVSHSRYDPRSDFYSLGVILYELLTGQLPFGPFPRRGSLKELAQAQLDRQAIGPKPIRQGNPQIDHYLARLIESCLSVDPDARPEAASQLAAALRKQLTPWRRARRWTACHRRATGLFAAMVTLVLSVIMVAAVARQPYSMREYQAGAAYAARGDYDRAIDHFSDAIRINPAFYDALVARGQAHQRRENYHFAIADYGVALALAYSSRVDSCRAYCLNCLRQHHAAIALYRTLVNLGTVSPAILNNLGFACLQEGEFNDAEKFLRHAIALDGNLQTPHYNLVQVFVNQALKGRSLPADALEHARRAEELGPPSGRLFRELATFYAIASRTDTSLVAAAIDHVKKAIQYGADAQAFRTDWSFSQLRQDQEFQKALATPQIANPPAALRFIDPLGMRSRADR
jgi:eukaryotic-like serine/threonine-protein kinase